MLIPTFYSRRKVVSKVGALLSVSQVVSSKTRIWALRHRGNERKEQGLWGIETEVQCLVLPCVMSRQLTSLCVTGTIDQPHKEIVKIK